MSNNNQAIAAALIRIKAATNTIGQRISALRAQVKAIKKRAEKADLSEDEAKEVLVSLQALAERAKALALVLLLE